MFVRNSFVRAFEISFGNTEISNKHDQSILINLTRLF